MRALPDDPHTTARRLSEINRPSVRLQASAVALVSARLQLCRAEHSRIQFLSAYWQTVQKGVYARHGCDISLEGYSARFGARHERCPHAVHDLCRHDIRHGRPPLGTLRLVRAFIVRLQRPERPLF